MEGGPAGISSNMQRDDFSKSFRPTSVVCFRAKVERNEGVDELSLSLSLSLAREGNGKKDRPKSNTGGNTTRRKSLTSIRLDGRNLHVG